MRARGAALAHCEQLLREGADILDIGGESTPAGHDRRCRWRKSWPACCRCCAKRVKLGVPVSVDTYKPEVMREALDLGVDIINDIWALRRPGAREVVAAHPRLRHLPDAHARRAADHAALADGRATPCRRSRPSCAQASTGLARTGRGPRPHRLGSRASASARPSSRTSRCWRASTNCWQPAIRWSWAGRASRRWAASPDCPSMNDCPPAWRRHCWRWSGAPMSCACTM